MNINTAYFQKFCVSDQISVARKPFWNSTLNPFIKRWKRYSGHCHRHSAKKD